MLKHMRAVVSPQTVVNDCMSAVERTGLGRGNILVNDLEVDHFTFVVRPDEYKEVSTGISGGLMRCHTVAFSPQASMTIGLQEKTDKSQAISWYYGYPLPGLAVIDASMVPLKAGGGFASVYAPSVEYAYQWLRERGIQYEIIALDGRELIWVPLTTPDYGVGEGYFALAIHTETLYDILDRMEIRARTNQLYT
jgi:hypothetical protein